MSRAKHLELDRLDDSPTSVELVASLDAACFDSPWSRSSWEQDLAAEHLRVWVAKATAQPGVQMSASIVAYACVSVVGDEAELRRIAVAPAHRRGGWGSACLQAIVGELKQARVRTLWLEVRASNRAALALYEGAGFELTRRRIAYYREPSEDGIDMRLEL